MLIYSRKFSVQSQKQVLRFVIVYWVKLAFRADVNGHSLFCFWGINLCSWCQKHKHKHTNLHKRGYVCMTYQTAGAYEKAYVNTIIICKLFWIITFNYLFIFPDDQAVAKNRLHQTQMIAGLIIHLSPSYFRCLWGKYLDSIWSKGVFACQRRCCSTWPDEMGMEIASLLIFFGAVWKQTHLHSSAKDNPPVNTVQRRKRKKKASPLSFIWLF